MNLHKDDTRAFLEYIGFDVDSHYKLKMHQDEHTASASIDPKNGYIKDLGKKGEIELNITKQQLAIASFSGWGGINGLFDEQNEKWQKEREELKALLGENDYNAARRSNLTAYYTPKNIVQAMYNGLEKLGINKDEPNLTKQILEPSVGNGSFITFNDNENFHFTGLDIEPLTIKMNKILYPNQKNYTINYEKFKGSIKLKRIFSYQFQQFLI